MENRPSDIFDRAGLAELVAHTDHRTVIAIVEGLIQGGLISEVNLVRPPQVGTVQLQVREPIVDERFVLADALVTTADVVVDGEPGWAARSDVDPEGAVAAAALDAWLSAGHDGDDFERNSVIQQLVNENLLREADANLRLTDILRTAIEFEELD